jgi:hypothetical protein
MAHLQPVYTVSVQAVLSFPVEASSAQAALAAWQSWQRRYRGQILVAGGGVAVLVVDTAAVTAEAAPGGG